jgi:hypothetical protein
MISGIDALMNALRIEPVLLDIGASAKAPEIWKPIAGYSTIVGFDPDERALAPAAHAAFKRGILVRQAVTAGPDTKVTFYMTRFPYCSSTLPPDSRALNEYLFADLFAVESQVVAPATTLDAALREHQLRGIDWFKTDSQGTDLRLFNSLNAETRNRVLAVDVEPGLIDAYVGEDHFVEAHADLMRQGFWLSNLELGAAVRLRPATLSIIQASAPEITGPGIERRHKKSPGWCEARYLRSLGAMESRAFTVREYALLWVFALLDQQFGFALDVAVECRKRFGESEPSRLMWDEALSLLKQTVADVLAPAAPPVRFRTRLARRLRRLLRG